MRGAARKGSPSRHSSDLGEEYEKSENKGRTLGELNCNLK